jgi:hypothetical protein
MTKKYAHKFALLHKHRQNRIVYSIITFLALLTFRSISYTAAERYIGFKLSDSDVNLETAPGRCLAILEFST